MIIQELISILGFKTDEASMANAQQKFEGVVGKMQSYGVRMSAFITAPLVMIGKAAIRSAANMEDELIAFGTLLQSAEKAKTLMADLVKMGAETPFELSDLAGASKKLLSYGVANEDLLPTLRMLGDVSLGNKDKFDRLALAYGQVMSKGRLMGQETLQMVETGFNPLKTISDMTGESMAELSKKMEKGQISAKMVSDAFQYITSSGQRFFNGMENASKTLTGRWSTFKDYLSAAMRGVVENVMPTLKKIVEMFISATSAFNELSAGIKIGIFVFGALLAVLGPLIVVLSTLSGVGLLFSNVLGLISKAAIRAGVSMGAFMLSSLATVAIVIAAIAGLLLIFDDVYQYLNGGDSVIGRFLAPWTELGPKIRQKLLPYWYLFVDAFNSAKDIVVSLLGFVVNIFMSDSEKASKNMEKLISSIIGFIIDGSSFVLSLLAGIAKALIILFTVGLGMFVMKIADMIMTFVDGLFTGIKNYVVNTFNEIWDAVKDTPIGRIISGGIDLAAKGIGVISDFFGGDDEKKISVPNPSYSGNTTGVTGFFGGGASNTVTNELKISIKPDISVPAGTSEQQQAYLRDSADVIFKRGIEQMTRQMNARLAGGG